MSSALMPKANRPTPRSEYGKITERSRYIWKGGNVTMVAKRDEWMSVEDFLALDRESLDQKYEYIDGHMYALAGGSSNHGLIISNTNTIISQHLKKSPCVTLVEMTLKIEDACFLPDVMVTCNEQD